MQNIIYIPKNQKILIKKLIYKIKRFNEDTINKYKVK